MASTYSRRRSGFQRSRIGAAVFVALGLGPAAALANPQGGVVQAGSVRIQQTTPHRMDIVQGTPRAAIDWRSFSIGAGEHVNFQQPSASAATLNRVVGVDPSQILGRLTANGQVFLLNPNGVMFGAGSRVDVGSLVASTSRLSNSDFMAGRLRFEAAARPGATVVNHGEINVARGGLVALVAPGVENAGVIRAQLGRVALASGQNFTLDLYGDQLVRLALDDAALDRLSDVHGRSLRSLVTNSGRIEADGGSVWLAANTASSVLDAAINMSGVIQARGFEQRGSEIVLHAGAAGAVQAAGTLDASATLSGPAGSVQVRGRDVAIEAGARIAADAAASGDGGRVIVFADRDAQFAGTITARGGAQRGDGGFVEVSGKQSLGYRGTVNASAPQGRAGTLLLDPTDWIVDTATADRLSLDLRAGTNVALQADNLIEVNDSIDGRGGVAGATLSLDAGNRIALNNDLLTNNGAITLTAGAGGVQMGAASRTTGNNGAVVFAGNQTIGIQSVGSVDAQHLITSGAITVRATGAGANVAFGRDLNGLGSTPIGSLDATAAGSISVGGLNASGAARLDAGGALTFTPSAGTAFTAASVEAGADGAVALGRDVVSSGAGALTITSRGATVAAAPGSAVSSLGGGTVTLSSAGRLTLADVFTTGAVQLESSADSVDLTRDLLGAAGSTGIGALTLRSAGALTLDNAVRSSGGIDIRSGGTSAAAARDLVVALAPGARLEANADGAGVAQPIALGGANVDVNAGELHANGGAIAIDARNGHAAMSAGAGLFAASGNIAVNATGQIALTRISTTGALVATSSGGGIRLDGDLGADLSGSEQRVGAVTLTAGGAFTQSRTYYTGYNFGLAPGAQTPPSVTLDSLVGVRVRGIRSSGPVSVTSTQPGAEVLIDGVIDAQGHVAISAPLVRARHSVFASGGNITVGGPLVVEPWGDEIVFECGSVCNPGAVDPGSLLLTSNTFGVGGVADATAPGSALTVRPRNVGMVNVGGAYDVASSQVTLRATAAGGVGGGIELTGAVGRELDIRADQQYVRLDRAAGGVGFAEPLADGPVSRSDLALVPMNDVRLQLQASGGVTFRAGAGGNFTFTGTQQARRLTPNNDINEPYFRLVIADPAGVPNTANQQVVDATGAVVPSGFAGTLHSLNNTPPGGSGVAGALTSAAPLLPGANFILSYQNPSGLEAPPGPTTVTPGSFAAGEITPGTTAGTGSGGADTAGGGIALADARVIAPPPPPPPPAPAPLPPPPPAPAPAPAPPGLPPEPAPEPTPAPAPGPAPSPAPADPAPRSSEDTLLAMQPPGAGLVFDVGADLLKVADLGRAPLVRGSATDVFRARSNVANLAAPPGLDIDADYFSLSIFDYLLRRLTRGRGR